MMPTVDPEFSRPFELADAAERVRRVSLEAAEPEMTALAARFEVNGLTNVHADLEIAPHMQGYCVTGRVTADASQVCVVTQALLDIQIEAPINVLLWTDEVEGELDALEEAYGVADIDPIDTDIYDLGEMCAQFLALAIDPFPRADGASFDAKLPQEKTNPFSVLAQLKDKA